MNYKCNLFNHMGDIQKMQKIITTFMQSKNLTCPVYLMGSIEKYVSAISFGLACLFVYRRNKYLDS